MVNGGREKGDKPERRYGLWILPSCGQTSKVKIGIRKRVEFAHKTWTAANAICKTKATGGRAPAHTIHSQSDTVYLENKEK